MVSELVIIDYTNWRGERRKRKVYPLSLRMGATKWHPETQWLLSAMDMEDNRPKDFAMKDIHGWEPTNDR